jgi:hypothetical protein
VTGDISNQADFWPLAQEFWLSFFCDISNASAVFENSCLKFSLLIHSCCGNLRIYILDTNGYKWSEYLMSTEKEEPETENRWVDCWCGG